MEMPVCSSALMHVLRVSFCLCEDLAHLVFAIVPKCMEMRTVISQLAYKLY